MRIDHNKCMILLVYLSIIFISFCACGHNESDKKEIPSKEIPSKEITLNEKIETKEMVLDILVTEQINFHFVEYESGKDDSSGQFGLDKLASIIKHYKNMNDLNDVVLVDNGNFYDDQTIEMKRDEKSPAYEVLSYLGYDAAGIGSGELSCGIDNLQKMIASAGFPVINANLYDAQTGENKFQPYTIVGKEIADESGMVNRVKIGIIAFITKEEWDEAAGVLGECLTMQDVNECARHFAPIMRAEGAQLVIGIVSGEGVEKVSGVDLCIVKDMIEIPENGEGLGRISLKLAEKKDDLVIEDITKQILSTGSLAAEPGAEKILQPYRQKTEGNENERK